MEKSNNYIYLVLENMIISDPDYMRESEGTFDISIFDLANNEPILDLINLSYMRGNYGVRYTYQTRAEWFCGYLSAYGGKDKDGRYEKLLTNPVVRVLISNEELMKKVKALKSNENNIN